ncbi:hypothetical protein C2R22_18580 [Salinigranum rubrum]|uniref:Uncharacterized protein n=1 Tax=Salinigranum rubrum TaxID=755307 RepID=A0A2I8VNA6_9EURY|nr:hypothetical protein [Salinigranum rubrum]AUV83401.1 hypothetical protein C2R22_18580 [Salinigranum rubrum]
MPNGDGDDVERITRPLGTVIRDVGLAVAEGQQELDRKLRTQYLSAPDDGPVDLETPWYRFAEVEVDLQLHFHTHELVERPPGHVARAVEGKGGVAAATPRYEVAASVATPSDPGFAEHERSGASRIRFRIIPVTPPPLSRAETSGTNEANGANGEGDEDGGDDENGEERETE